MMRPIATALLVPLLLLAGLAVPLRAQPADSHLAPPMLDDGWTTASAVAVGLDPVPLQHLAEAIRRGDDYPNVHAVLIAKDGRLVYEAYFEGEDVRRGTGPLGHVVFDREMRHDLRSVTKSVVSALVGLAIAEGAIHSVDQPLLDFFPEHADLATPERRAITLRHALDMSAGLAWNEQIPYTDPLNDEIRMNRSADPVRFVLERPVVSAPGTAWVYSGGLTQVLAEVVQRATGRPLLDFARETLFEPLGITDVEWVTDAGQTTPSAASGLRLRPRDLAKIGLVYQQAGRWNGQQVIPAAWVAASQQRRIALPDSLVEFGEGASAAVGYGSQWWHAEYALPYGRVTAHRAIGNGGQLVFVVPELGLTAVVLSGNYNGPQDAARLVLERVVPWALGDDATYRFWSERPVRYVAPGEWPEQPLAPASRAPYVGTYDLDGERIRVWEEGGVLHVTPFSWAQGGPIHLVPTGEHLFAYGLYEGGRLTRVYWSADRLGFEVEGERAVRLIDRTAVGHVYATGPRVE